MKKHIEFLDHLILTGKMLPSYPNAHNPHTNPGIERSFEYHYTKWIEDARSVLSHANLEPYLDTFIREISHSSPREKIPNLVGILHSARDCLEQGFVGKLKYLLHAEMFDSFVGQAKELLANGFLLPAGVVSRIIIERWLRDQGEKQGIEGWSSKKASQVNDELKRGGTFSTNKWRLIQSLLDAGNAAAHGNEDEISKECVQRMIDFIESQCLETP